MMMLAVVALANSWKASQYLLVSVACAILASFRNIAHLSLRVGTFTSLDYHRAVL